MKKIFYLAAASAMVLASCSNNDMFDEAQVAQDLGSPVSFGTYTAKATRAGAPGSIQKSYDGSKTAEQVLAEKGGFGVFAYYTKNADYNSTQTPDWMWNQAVTSTDGENWTYAPVKYWPNDNVKADNDNAQGTTASKISFFAYAPYVGNPKTGELTNPGTSGITAISDNETAGDPIISYTMSETGEMVDLLWGTAAENNNYQTVSGTTINGAKAGDNALFATNINLIKLKTGQKIKFNFKHALAKFGGSGDDAEGNPETGAITKAGRGLQVVLDIDKEGAIKGGSKGDETRVTIKSIKISSDTNGDGTVDVDPTGADASKDKGIATSGQLNLALGTWTLPATPTYAAVNQIIASEANSGLADGVTANATIKESLAEPASVAASDGAWTSNVVGVTTIPQNVYKDETNPLVFIPGTRPTFRITVTYVVRTADAHLKTGYTEAEQTISKLVTFEQAVQLNKQYNMILHFGLTSIKFEATVDDWENADGATPTTDLNGDGVIDEKDAALMGIHVDLPINVTD